MIEVLCANLFRDLLEKIELLIGQACSRQNAGALSLLRFGEAIGHHLQRLIPISFNQLTVLTNQRLGQAVFMVDIGVTKTTTHTEIAVVDTYFVIETDRLNLIVLNTQGNGTTITAVTADRINFLELPGTGLELEGPWQESTNRAHGETLTAEFTVQASIICCGNFGLKTSIDK